MSRYIDGFVLPIPKSRIDDYRGLAEIAARVWKDHGALEYWEFVGDDLSTEGMASFMDIAAAGPDETVIFAWAAFASREARDEANKKIMADPRLNDAMSGQAKTLFDCRKMAYGGFRELVRG